MTLVHFIGPNGTLYFVAFDRFCSNFVCRDYMTVAMFKVSLNSYMALSGVTLSCFTDLRV